MELGPLYPVDKKPIRTMAGLSGYHVKRPSQTPNYRRINQFTAELIGGYYCGSRSNVKNYLFKDIFWLLVSQFQLQSFITMFIQSYCDNGLLSLLEERTSSITAYFI